MYRLLICLCLAFAGLAVCAPSADALEIRLFGGGFGGRSSFVQRPRFVQRSNFSGFGGCFPQQQSFGGCFPQQQSFGGCFPQQQSSFEFREFRSQRFGF